MTEDSSRHEVGEVSRKSLERDVITWKIPNVSSLVITEDGGMQSPSFTLKNATWTLKMYPYGRTDSTSKEHIVVVFERLHSQISVHKLLFRLFFQSDNDVGEDVGHETDFVFDASSAQRHVTFHNNWYKNFYRGKLRCNDTITLVCEIQSEKDVIEVDYRTESLKAALSSRINANEGFLQPIGELVKESFEMEVIAWTIPTIHSMPVEVDYRVESPSFTFAGASWILKMFPYGQKKFNSKGYVDVVIKRLHSQFPNNSILYEMELKSYGEREPLLEGYYRKTSPFICDNIQYSSAEGFFIFDSNRMQEDVVFVLRYSGCLNLAASSHQCNIVVVTCALQSKKNVETYLHSQSESVQFAVDPVCTATEASARREVGEVFKKELEREVITWKIHNVTSLVTAIVTEVKSSPFSFKSATWILKMYPFGRNDGSRGRIAAVIQRLHSQLPVHNLFCWFYFQSSVRNKRDRKDARSGSFAFDSNRAEGDIHFYHTCHTLFYSVKKNRCNDTITLVCEIQSEKDPAVVLDVEAPLETALSYRFNANEGSLQPIGELFTESFEMEVFAWTIPTIHSMPVEVDYRVESPTFSFAGASWILKMFPYGQRKFKSERYVDVVIQRLHSQIPSHSILYNIILQDYDGKDPLSAYECRKNPVVFHKFRPVRIPGSFTFSSNHTQENIINVFSYDECLNLAASDRQRGACILVCELMCAKSLKNAETSLNSEMEQIQSTVGNDGK